MAQYKMILRDLWNLDWLFKPVHPSNLAVTRIAFGFLMLFDIPDERGGSEIDIRWGDPKTCHFPLFESMYQPPFAIVCIMYGAMWLGALGICVGYKFHFACASYLLPYWYILLMDKSFWNNHSYLYGLIAFLISFTSAGDYWSLDAILNVQKDKPLEIPYWNYFLLKFQVFCLYFIAGLKKLDMEWLEGYSMSNLGKHWIFHTFSIIMSTDQVDYIVIHVMGFLLDLTVGFFLLIEKTRPYALFACGMFHLMNSRLFSIGMFPYVCIATMPLFCNPDWPIKLIRNVTNQVKKWRSLMKGVRITCNNRDVKQENGRGTILKLFLPWSHFITKGYNNWTNGMYGYSWDMMVHSWDTTLVIVRILDRNSNEEMFLDPSAWVHNDKWNKHADMVLQYAKCLERNFDDDLTNKQLGQKVLSTNISIYVDVWCSLNGRFQQRMFNPYYDLLQANWSPFTKVEWLLPLLIEYSNFREKMKSIQEDVYSWNNYSDVLFIADFPDMYLENFITKDLTNISLVIIEGTVIYESGKNQSVLLHKGDSISIASNVFHKVKTISKMPSCFMYTYVNSTKEELKEDNAARTTVPPKSAFPLLEDGQETLASFVMMFKLIGNALLYIFYDVPLVRRARVE